MKFLLSNDFWPAACSIKVPTEPQSSKFNRASELETLGTSETLFIDGGNEALKKYTPITTLNVEAEREQVLSDSKMFGRDENLPKLRLNADDNSGGFPTMNNNGGNCHVNSETERQMQVPGLIARLMRLESLPAVQKDKLKKVVSEKHVVQNDVLEGEEVPIVTGTRKTFSKLLSPALMLKTLIPDSLLNGLIEKCCSNFSAIGNETSFATKLYHTTGEQSQRQIRLKPNNVDFPVGKKPMVNFDPGGVTFQHKFMNGEALSTIERSNVINWEKMTWLNLGEGVVSKHSGIGDTLFLFDPGGILYPIRAWSISLMSEISIDFETDHAMPRLCDWSFDMVKENIAGNRDILGLCGLFYKLVRLMRMNSKFCASVLIKIGDITIENSLNDTTQQYSPDAVQAMNSVVTLVTTILTNRETRDLLKTNFIGLALVRLSYDDKWSDQAAIWMVALLIILLNFCECALPRLSQNRWGTDLPLGQPIQCLRFSGHPGIIILRVEETVRLLSFTSSGASCFGQLLGNFLAAAVSFCTVSEALILVTCSSIGIDDHLSPQQPKGLIHINLSYTYLINMWSVFMSSTPLKALKSQAARHLVDCSPSSLYTEDVFPGVCAVGLSSGMRLSWCSLMHYTSLSGVIHMDDLNRYFRWNHAMSWEISYAQMSFCFCLFGLMLLKLVSDGVKLGLLQHQTRGRFTPLEGWEDDKNANIEMKQIMVEICVVIIGSSITSLFKNGRHFREFLKLSYNVVNGLDAPTNPFDDASEASESDLPTTYPTSQTYHERTLYQAIFQLQLKVADAYFSLGSANHCVPEPVATIYDTTHVVHHLDILSEIIVGVFGFGVVFSLSEIIVGGFMVGSDIAFSLWLLKEYNIGCKFANGEMMAVLNVLRDGEIIEDELVSVVEGCDGIDLELTGHCAIFGATSVAMLGTCPSTEMHELYIEDSIIYLTVVLTRGRVCYFGTDGDDAVRLQHLLKLRVNSVYSCYLCNEGIYVFLLY